MQLTSKIDRACFPRLRDFSLFGVPFSESGIFKFVELHRRTLRRLSLHPIQRAAILPDYIEKFKAMELEFVVLCCESFHPPEALSPFGPNFFIITDRVQTSMDWLDKMQSHFLRSSVVSKDSTDHWWRDYNLCQTLS